MLRALTEQSERGDGIVLRLALARTAGWLIAGRGGRGRATAREQGAIAREESGTAYTRPDAWLVETGSGIGRLRHALSPVSFDGGPSNWARPPGRWGADQARWA